MSECDRIQECLGAWLDGELPQARTAEVKLHVEKCAACAAEKERIQRLDAALKRALEARVSDAAFAPFWAGVRERIAREKSLSQRGFDWMRGVFAFPRLAWAVPVAAVVLIAVFSTIRSSGWFALSFAPTNQASVESIDGHGFNVALLREAKTKTTVIWLFENQETEDDNSVEPAASEQAF